MEKKENQKVEAGNKAVASPKSNSKVLLWILGGCLILLLIAGLAIGGIAYWSYKKVKKEIKENQSKIEQRQNETDKTKEEPQNVGQPTLAPTQESPQAISEEPTPSGFESAEGAMPYSGERQIGYVKKVYTKNGKNYLSVDYIQWLTGAEAEKAMREDGQCPKTGECIVYDDYYIRNQNPLIRTFPVAPDAEILAHDFSKTTYGDGNWNESWTFSRFSQYFNSKDGNFYWSAVPFHVEIGNNEIIKITEQYIP